MADLRGPIDMKFCPVDSMLGPWISVGYEKKKKQVR